MLVLTRRTGQSILVGDDIVVTILELSRDQVRIGMRVEPVWVDDDQLAPSFESIKWWRPIDEPDVPAESLKGHM